MAKNTGKKQKRVIKAIAIFVAALAVLTFFSNTIMNMTIPKVTASYSSRGNLSYTNSASGTTVIDNASEVKGIEGRVVEEVKVENYDTVNKGDTIVTLKALTDTTELDDLKTQLTSLQREAEYEERTPSDNDLSSYQSAVKTAQQALNEANDQLSQAQGKSSTISSAQKTIDDNSSKQVSLEASVASASDTVEELNQQIDELKAQIETLDTKINVFTTLGTPTPTPTPEGYTAPSEEAEETEATEATTGSEESGTEESAEPTATATPTATPAPDTSAIDELCAQKADCEEQITKLESQLAEAQSRLNSLSGDLASVQSAIEEAQAKIDATNELPSESEAKSAISAAQDELKSAKSALADAKTNAAIAADQKQDTIEDRQKQMDKLEKQIAELEEKTGVTEIKAPAAGYVYNLAVAAGDELTDAGIITTILPEDRQASVTFQFAASSASNLYVGQELTVQDSYWIDSCTIEKIKPNADNPRETRDIVCSLVAGDGMLWPGETITVMADRGNQNYDTIVAASAVNEDNAGKFVYVVEGSSTPLGDKYTVKRVDVTVEATDGSLTAISGENLEYAMIVTRSEEPLTDGQRVRLEDYTGSSSDSN